jgi:tyrosyl-tRNA synthetase
VCEASTDCRQYFLKTADNDVERYLKLFTFLPLDQIDLVMGQQRKDESKRLAQHILAKELVELVHGAKAAKNAETAHKEAFSHSMSSIRTAQAPKPAEMSKKDKAYLAYKKSFGASNTAQAISGTTYEQPRHESQDIITLPQTLLQPGSFPRVLQAAGLASSKSEAHRLIASKGAYVVVPNSGTTEAPTALQWINIEAGATADPSHFLVDWDALVLRSGKSKIQICHIVPEDEFAAKGLTCPGWEELKAKRVEGKEKESSA